MLPSLGNKKAFRGYTEFEAIQLHSLHSTSVNMWGEIFQSERLCCFGSLGSDHYLREGGGKT